MKMNREMTAPRVVLYCRVATDVDEGRSLAMQKQRLRAYAEQCGYEVVAEVSDIGSGRTLDRPGIRTVFRMAHQHLMDMVVSVNHSRFCREPSLLLRLAGKLKKQHVTLDTPQGGIPEQFRQMAKWNKSLN